MSCLSLISERRPPPRPPPPRPPPPARGPPPRAPTVDAARAPLGLAAGRAAACLDFAVGFGRFAATCLGFAACLAFAVCFGPFAAACFVFPPVCFACFDCPVCFACLV